MTMPRGFILSFFFLFILCSSSADAMVWNWHSTSEPSHSEGYAFVTYWADSGSISVRLYRKSVNNDNGESGFIVLSVSNGTSGNKKIVSDLFTWTCIGTADPYECIGVATVPNLDTPVYNGSTTLADYDWLDCSEADVNVESPGVPSGGVYCTDFASENSETSYEAAGWQILHLGVDSVGGAGMWVGSYLDTPEMSDTLSHGMVCYDSPDVIDHTSGIRYYLNSRSECTECSTPGEISCTFNASSQSLGRSWICGNNYHWAFKSECKNGGWDDCGLSSPLDCPGASSTVSIANRERVPERISLTDNLGRVLLWTGNGYRLFSGQTIQESAFVFIDNYTKGDWKLLDDAVSVVYSWNATEMSCSKTAGAQGYSAGSAFYVDNSDYNCLLLSGYSTSNITITITANLTTVGSTVVRNPVLTKTFNVELVNDVALLDNLQAVYVNATHFAFSGHIIKLSDLSEIPESSSPYVTFTYSVYSNTSSNTLVYSNNSGVLNATDANALYSFVNSSGQGLGSLVRYTAVVGASGYANSSYYLDSAYISPLRLVYFKCRNVPKNTNASTKIVVPGGFKFTMGLQTWYYDATKTSLFSEPVRFVCQYKLENASAILPSTLGTQSTISKSNDVGSDSVTTGFFEFTIVNSSSSPIFAYSSNVEVPFSHAIGIEVFNELEQAFYTKFDSSGNPGKLEAGRYVGRWAILDNPVFYQVKTYVDLVINNENPLGTSFNFISFNQTVYKEGDDVLCSVSYDDVNGLIQNWAIDISGESGSVTVNDATNVTCTPSQTSSCVYATQISCGKTIGETPRVCMVQAGIYGVQECTSRFNNSDLTSACLSYKNKFFSGGGDKTLTCTVRLYEASGVGGKVITQSATATVFVNSEDLISSLLKGISWQWWIFIIILLIIGLLMLKWRLQGGRRG